MSTYKQLAVTAKLRKNKDTEILVSCLSTTLNGTELDVTVTTNFSEGNVIYDTIINGKSVVVDYELSTLLVDPRFDSLGGDVNANVISDLPKRLLICETDDSYIIELTACTNCRSKELHDNLIRFLRKHNTGDLIVISLYEDGNTMGNYNENDDTLLACDYTITNSAGIDESKIAPLKEVLNDRFFMDY